MQRRVSPQSGPPGDVDDARRDAVPRGPARLVLGRRQAIYQQLYPQGPSRGATTGPPGNAPARTRAGRCEGSRIRRGVSR
ncbi:hypothetical protein Q9Q76_21685, partial [Mycobacterium intracellulare]|uniref:hypothetical protein n=1 Tax=Mycobacterium intracellulare TaxID=1767 RepID=UPI00334DF37E